MIFQTISGSVYEINETDKQIRRLTGIKDPTPRQGKDGSYRSYSAIFPDPITVGEQVLIVWTKDTPLLPETKLDVGEVGIPTTTTSPIAKIIDEKDLS